MNQNLRFILLVLFIHSYALSDAQRFENISANNIKATYSSGGVLYMIDTATRLYSGTYGLYEVPKGSGRTTIFAGAPWLTAIDQYNDLRGAFNLYDPNANFHFGPVANDHLVYDSSYQRVYKVLYGHIRAHQASYADPGYQMPTDIAEWPGNGDTSKGEPLMIAPFADLNGNNIYEPTQGEYPDICGDDAIFMVLNDSIGQMEYACSRMFTEIHILAYSFDVPSDSILFNTTFLHYTIINRSTEVYHDVRFSVFFDTDIGCPDNDRIGCDTTLNSYFAYNDPDIPDGNVCSGGIKGYGNEKVTQGFTFLNQKLTAFTNMQEYNLDEQNPFCNRMRQWQTSKWTDGTHITYGGNGYQNSLTSVNYLFPGDPRDSTQWSELYPQIGPAISAGDRRMVGTVSFDTLRPGESRIVDIALVTAFADSNASPLSEIGVLKQNIQSVQRLYDLGETCHSTSLTSGVRDQQVQSLIIYPNPARSSLYLSDILNGAAYTIIDVTGRENRTTCVDKQIDISALCRGVYVLRISYKEATYSYRFIKE